MGDKDGAREILQEVMKEGDAAQQAEAKQLLDSLG
jgi:FimV-like protein